MHHLAGALGASSMMFYKKAAFFPIAVMISEITVIPVNWVWYLRSCGVPEKSLHAKLAKFIRAILFLSLRAPIAPLAVYYALQTYKIKISGEIDYSKAWREVSALPLPVTLGIATNLVLFGGLNLYWTLGAMTAMKSKKSKSI